MIYQEWSFVFGGAVPKVTEEHRQAMRLRIQDAALACIARKGFGRTSMADIVKEAGLSAGAVYVYYSSKAELTTDVGRRVMEQRVAGLEDFGDAAEVPAPREVFPPLLDSLLDDDPLAPTLLQIWGESAHDKEFAEIAGTIFESLLGFFTDYLRAYFRRSAAMDGDAAELRARELAPAILAMMQGAVVQTTVFGPSARASVGAGFRAMLAHLECSASPESLDPGLR